MHFAAANSLGRGWMSLIPNRVHRIARYGGAECEPLAGASQHMRSRAMRLFVDNLHRYVTVGELVANRRGIERARKTLERET